MAGKRLRKPKATPPPQIPLFQKILLLGPMPPMIRSRRSQKSLTRKLKRAPRLRKRPKKLPQPKSPVEIEARVPQWQVNVSITIRRDLKGPTGVHSRAPPLG